MLETIFMNLWSFWAILAVLFLLLELGSGDLFLLCLGIASALTVIISLVNNSFWLHLAFFAIFSLLSLMIIRPPLLKLLHRGEDQRVSNADALKGKTGVVVQDIPAGDFGRVMLGGDDWKAQSADGTALPKGTRVRMVSRESILLTVEKIETKG